MREMVKSGLYSAALFIAAALRQFLAECCLLSAASADGSARVWDMEIGDCVLLMEGHTAAVTDLAVANEGSVLVTSSADHTARVWTLDKGQCRAVLQGHTAAVNAVAVDAQGRFVVTASADATGRVWDLHSGQCAHVLRGHGAAGAGKICTMTCSASDLSVAGASQVFISTELHRKQRQMPSDTCIRQHMFANTYH